MSFPQQVRPSRPSRRVRTFPREPVWHRRPARPRRPRGGRHGRLEYRHLRTQVVAGQEVAHPASRRFRAGCVPACRPRLRRSLRSSANLFRVREIPSPDSIASGRTREERLAQKLLHESLLPPATSSYPVICQTLVTKTQILYRPRAEWSTRPWAKPVPIRPQG